MRQLKKEYKGIQMISVDTNVVVRLLTRDDEQQYKKAYSIFESENIFLTDTVILESEWVLRFAYSFTRIQISNSFLKLIRLPNINLTAPMAIYDALQWYADGLDFADALHLALSQHCEKMASFDKSFITKSTGLCPCKVSLP